VHVRNTDRLTAVHDLLDRGAAAVVGDLSDVEQTRGVADQVNRLPRSMTGSSRTTWWARWLASPPPP
jgi:hypothetical protein